MRKLNKSYKALISPNIDKYALLAHVNWAYADKDLRPKVKDYVKKKKLVRYVMFNGDCLLSDADQYLVDRFVVEVMGWFCNEV